MSRVSDGDVGCHHIDVTRPASTLELDLTSFVPRFEFLPQVRDEHGTNK